VHIDGPFNGPACTGNVIGGTTPGEGNFLSGGGAGVRIAGWSDETVVIGNTLTGGDFGVWVIGSIYSTTPKNNRIGGPTPEERNIIAGAGSYCCEGAPSGAQVSLEYAESTIVEGNWIGLTPDGMASEGQVGPAGVDVYQSSGNVIRNNVIGGIYAVGVNHYAGDLFGDAVHIEGESDANVVQGNTMGTDPTGTIPIPNLRGVTLAEWLFADKPTDNVIGGVAAADGNLIAFSVETGVRVGSVATGTAIRGNSIHSNGLLGIDLLGFLGVTQNDPGDADTGGNGLQNFPELAGATTSASGTTVTGTLNSHANETFAIDVFANAACDPSGHGEGETFLGSFEVMTGGNGIASFDATVEGQAPEGSLVTTTATRVATSDTSEFSACVTAEAGCAADFNGDGSLNILDFVAFQNAFVAGDPDADCDGNGALNVLDFVCFQNLFKAGCP
jgi:hypothetical protein